jgi:uncharacterized protein
MTRTPFAFASSPFTAAAVIAAAVSLTIVYAARVGQAPSINVSPSAPAANAAGNPRGSMTVSGTATVEASPDVADMHITLSSQQLRPRMAAAAVHAKQVELGKELAAIGIETKDLSMSRVTMSPTYDPKGRLSGYSAAITVTASTHDFESLPEMMEVATAAGATSTSTDFRVSDMPSLKKKVRDQALAALKAKAEQSTNALGAKLLHVTSIAENQGGEAWNWNANTVTNSISYQASPVEGMKADAQSLTLTITATYELG